MTLGSHTKQWEPYAVYVLIGLILLLFLYTMVLVVRKSASKPVLSSHEIATATSSVARASNYYRQYARPLEVHELGTEWKRQDEDTPDVDDYSIANPGLRRSADPAQSIDAGYMPMPVAMPTRPVRSDSGDEDEEDDAESGWGWLADDIKTSREAREAREEDNNRNEMDSEAIDDEERLASTPESASTAREKVFFMDTAYQQDKGEQDGFFPDAGKNSGQDSLADFEYAREQGSDGPREYGGREDAESIRREETFGASPGSGDLFGQEAWRPAFSRPDTEERSGIYGDPVAEAAETASSPEPIYKSDSYFSSGGNNYDSPAFGGTRSESVFSSDSIFSGNPGFASEPMGSTLPVAPEATASGAGPSVGDDSPFKVPRALPW